MTDPAVDALAQLSLFDRPRPMPVTEIGKREAVLDSMDNREAVERRRKKARETSHNPAYGFKRYGIRHATSADVVNDELDIGLDRHGKSNNINGAIFRGGEWVCIGQVSSKREHGHGNRIGLYVLREHLDTAHADMAARSRAA